MYNWYQLIRPMELQDAVNYLAASRQAYNSNTDEELSLQETFEMVEECASNVGTNKDHAMIKAINDHVGKRSKKVTARLWQELEAQVDAKAVKKMLKDEMLFEESDEYTMTDEEYEQSEYFEDEYPEVLDYVGPNVRII